MVEKEFINKVSEAKSRSQQRLFSMAHGVKKGDLNPKDLDPGLRKKVTEIADSMSTEQIEDYSRTSNKNLPEKKASVEEFIDSAVPSAIGSAALTGILNAKGLKNPGRWIKNVG